jgi:hypothetical protein
MAQLIIFGRRGFSTILGCSPSFGVCRSGRASRLPMLRASPFESAYRSLRVSLVGVRQRARRAGRQPTYAARPCHAQRPCRARADDARSRRTPAEARGEAVWDLTTGYGHAVWRNAAGNERARRWTLEQARPSSRAVRLIDFTALDANAARAWWAAVEEWGPEPRPARFEHIVGRRSSAVRGGAPRHGRRFRGGRVLSNPPRSGCVHARMDARFRWHTLLRATQPDAGHGARALGGGRGLRDASASGRRRLRRVDHTRFVCWRARAQPHLFARRDAGRCLPAPRHRSPDASSDRAHRSHPRRRYRRYGDGADDGALIPE